MLFVFHMDKVLLSDMFANFIFYSMHHGIDNILKLRWEKFPAACQLGSARRCELSPKLQLDLVRTKGEMYSPWCGHVGFRAGYERSFDVSEWANLSLRPRLYLNLFIGIEKPIPP